MYTKSSMPRASFVLHSISKRCQATPVGGPLGLGTWPGLHLLLRRWLACSRTRSDLELQPLGRVGPSAFLVDQLKSCKKKSDIHPCLHDYTSLYMIVYVCPFTLPKFEGVAAHCLQCRRNQCQLP